MDDFEKLKRVASLLLSNLMGADLDLLVYQTLFQAMERNGVVVPDIEALLKEARSPNSPLKLLVLRKYIETYQGLQRYGQTDLDREWQSLMESWKPDDPANP
jgi:hypothetical protein